MYGIIIYFFGGVFIVFVFFNFDFFIKVEKFVLIGVLDKMEKVLNNVMEIFNVLLFIVWEFIWYIE